MSKTDAELLDGFDPNASYAFVTHGFVEKYPGNSQQIRDERECFPISTAASVFISCFLLAWLKQMTIDLAANNINVCAVNWGAVSSELLNYFMVSQVNTVRVAEYTHRVLERFERLGVKLVDVMLVGHSLGAQTFAKVGRLFRKQGKAIGSIYGAAHFPCSFNVYGIL